MPELLLAIKAEVDRARRPGRFLLTGSSHLLGAPQLADSLAGRMEALTLWPFTQAELDGAAGVPALIDLAFGAALSDLDPPAVARSEVLERAGAGGFLPAPARAGRRRNSWFDSYVAGVIDREVRALTDATYLRVLPRLLRLCAARTSGELNVTDPARDLGLFRPTTDSHLAHLEAVFLIQTPSCPVDESHGSGPRLRLLEHRFGPDFVAGIVLCTAPEPRHLGGRLWILPISARWQPGTRWPGDE